ncbi:Prefoldin 4 [Carabus blaptoides fortunei]
MLNKRRNLRCGSSIGKGTFQPDSDVHITYEDQQKINKFARLNAKMDDFKDEMKLKENELKNIEDACDELELADDEGGKIPYLIGEVFVYQNVENTLSSLGAAKSVKQKEIDDLKNKCSEVEELMSELKKNLYGKFGSHINLETDDD